MIEKVIQDEYIKALQAAKIDFVRIPNQAFKGKSRGAYSYGVFKEGLDNTKYFPDLMFCVNSVIFLREFGIKGKHSDRKEKQAQRMGHWFKHGGADVDIIYDIESAQADIKGFLSGSDKIPKPRTANVENNY